MACKSCKKNENNNIIEGISNLRKEMREITNGTPNGVDLFTYEKILLTIFGWIPLGVGYYHIVRFVINLF